VAAFRCGDRDFDAQPVAASLTLTAALQWAMGTKSRETIYGSSVRAAAEEAVRARKVADRLACAAWNKRMLGFQGPAQPSPALGDALNAGYLYLEVKCLGCNTHSQRPTIKTSDVLTSCVGSLPITTQRAGVSSCSTC
jgi:hypothetical protein